MRPPRAALLLLVLVLRHAACDPSLRCCNALYVDPAVHLCSLAALSAIFALIFARDSARASSVGISTCMDVTPRIYLLKSSIPMIPARAASGAASRDPGGMAGRWAGPWKHIGTPNIIIKCCNRHVVTTLAHSTVYHTIRYGFTL